MKLTSRIRYLAIGFCSVLLFSFSAHGQSTTMGSATIYSQTNIVLQNSTQFPSQYQANFSSLGFRSKTEAVTYFGRISDNLLTYTPDFATKTVVITIHKDRIPTVWTLTHWNKYINGKLTSL